MSKAPSTYRRRLGRAPSPPTWLWYEQIPYDDDSSCSDDDDISADDGDYDDDNDNDNSCSEDDEDYSRAHAARHERGGAPAAPASESGSSNADSGSVSDGATRGALHEQQERMRAADGATSSETTDTEGHAPGDHVVGNGGDDAKKDVKGKQRAVEPEVEESPKRRERRKKREPVFTLRPILTIQKSQGFVWNQDLFVPPYIKDRYVASTSPPNANGCSSTCTPSYNSMHDYEVDVVEIRVKEGEYADIIP